MKKFIGRIEVIEFRETNKFPFNEKVLHKFGDDKYFADQGELMFWLANDQPNEEDFHWARNGEQKVVNFRYSAIFFDGEQEEEIATAEYGVRLSIEVRKI